MNRRRVVVGPFGTRRVICSDGTVWADLSEAKPGPDGLTGWVQVKEPIPDVTEPTQRKADGPGRERKR